MKTTERLLMLKSGVTWRRAVW